MEKPASQPPPQWDIDRPFIKPVTVAAEHIDAFGHANNVSYLKWLEDVAWAHSEALGLGWAEFKALNTGFVVHRHELDYLSPTFERDELLTASWIHENNGRLEMWRRYQIIRISDGKTVLRATTRFICVDFTTGRPKRQPPAFVAAYAAGRGALD